MPPKKVALEIILPSSQPQREVHGLGQMEGFVFLYLVKIY